MITNLTIPMIYQLKFAFWSIWYSIINYRKARKFKKIEKSLDKAIYTKETNQIELMITIKKRIRSYYPKGWSKFIPLSIKQQREIHAAIVLEFGDAMKKHDVKLTKTLKFL